MKREDSKYKVKEITCQCGHSFDCLSPDSCLCSGNVELKRSGVDVSKLKRPCLCPQCLKVVSGKVN
jgi:hypothetical protein